MTTTTYHPSDLEAIVTLLEISAIYLTPSPGARFTFDQLLAQAREIGGDELPLDEADVRIVVNNASFLGRDRNGLYLR